jgi:transposase-like protein
LQLVAVRKVIRDGPLRALFQAAILTAHESGQTVRELADQLGTSPTNLFRWISEARERRNRIPHVETVMSPAVDDVCHHERLFSDDRKRVCLDCMETNFEDSPELRRHPNFDPRPEPIVRKVYRPGQLRGGKA